MTPTTGTRTHSNPGSYRHPGLRRTISEQIALFRLPDISIPSCDGPYRRCWLVGLSPLSRRDKAQKLRTAKPKLVTPESGSDDELELPPNRR